MWDFALQQGSADVVDNMVEGRACCLDCMWCVWAESCLSSSNSSMQFVANCSIQQHVGLALCATKSEAFQVRAPHITCRSDEQFSLGLLLTRPLQCSFSALHMQNAGTKDHQVVAGQL